MKPLLFNELLNQFQKNNFALRTSKTIAKNKISYRILSKSIRVFYEKI